MRFGVRGHVVWRDGGAGAAAAPAPAPCPGGHEISVAYGRATDDHVSLVRWPVATPHFCAELGNPGKAPMARVLPRLDAMPHPDRVRDTIQ
ncbi:unnamed protein product, partial [Symbiodinium natans]